MCALCATISYTTMAKLRQLLLAHSKRCWHSSSSHPPALCSLHTMQGKSISFTLQEPKAWVQALCAMLNLEAWAKNNKVQCLVTECPRNASQTYRKALY